jgi:hypothetical protein
MSGFEIACWNWYRLNATPLVFTSGLLGRLIDRLGLDVEREGLFIRALNMIREHFLLIDYEDARR